MNLNYAKVLFDVGKVILMVCVWRSRQLLLFSIDVDAVCFVLCGLMLVDSAPSS